MCSPIFGGVQMPYGNGSISTPYGQILGAIETGGPGTTPSVATGMVSEQAAHAMYNVHTYKFPGAALLNMVMDMVCAPKGSFDMDAVWFSEIDPTWQDEQLALYTAPETNLFANLYTHATCILDGVATTVRKPILGFWWCAGTWGPLYPQASRQQHSGEFDAQMLSAMKLIAHLHRFGMLTLKYGDLAVCKEIPWFVAPHEQYQFQNFWPMPVDDAKWPGTSFWLWGLGRTEPVAGEDRVMLEWDYHECCATLW
jgi:conjugal transfer pilus assembly protein TraU